MAIFGIICFILFIYLGGLKALINLIFKLFIFFGIPVLAFMVFPPLGAVIMLYFIYRLMTGRF